MTLFPSNWQKLESWMMTGHSTAVGNTGASCDVSGIVFRTIQQYLVKCTYQGPRNHISGNASKKFSHWSLREGA